MKKSHLKLLPLLLLSILAFSACKKKKQNEQATEIAQQNSLAESAFINIQFMADEASRGQTSFKTFNADCINLGYDTVGNTVTITIDFGTSNCLCKDEKNRRGKVYISYEKNKYETVGTVVTMTTDNYFVNDNQIIGKRTITRTDAFVWSIHAEAEIILTNNAGTITWQSDRVRTQVEGATTFALADNEYDVTGTASGVNAKGKSYSIKIDKTLRVQLGCRWIKSGSLNITSDGLSEDAVIDYGDGKCDNIATFTYRGKTKNLNL